VAHEGPDETAIAQRPRRPTARWTPADDAATAGQPRLFVAVPLAEAARAAVEELVVGVRDRLAAAGVQADSRAGVRWVRTDGLHLTLRFLGPTPLDQVDAVAAAAAQTATEAAQAPFEVVIGGAGAFPSPGRPRTLWLGIERGADELAALAAALDERLVPLGWPPEDRPFRPHLTLARADGRRAGPATAQALIEAAAPLRVPFEADRLVLFESVTGGGPARYLPRFEAGLGG
jgi:RNA 2',3'-cyclic 3'-phosphodiesterase